MIKVRQLIIYVEICRRVKTSFLVPQLADYCPSWEQLKSDLNYVEAKPDLLFWMGTGKGREEQLSEF